MKRIIMNVEGMSCGMCEAHVNDAVRAAFNVKKVSSSRSKKQTEIIANEELDENDLRAAVEAKGYKVTGIMSEEYKKKGLFGKK
ncbi:MAG: cation transporter [Firmicutes bacterium]|nr:cation transporter [Bacillota bacterium]